MKNNKRQNQWEQAQKKAENMTDKFITVLEKLNCYDSWESIMVERIINKMVSDSVINSSPKFEGIADMLESNFGFKIFKGDSLAEQIKIEMFLEELKENPYQLKLIA